MKTTTRIPLVLGLAAAFAVCAIAQDTVTPPAADSSPAPASKKDERKAARRAERKAAKRGAAATTAASSAAPAPATASAPASPAEPELRLNFRGVPLDLVLNYLSEAAGYTIILETPVKGTIDVWSNQPLTKAEAIDLLNTALNKNGYAAIQDGKKLTIVAKDEAKKRNIPVKSGSNPEAIPKNDEMVTQILPVRYINATQLTRDLQPLLPTSATMTANEGGNALVITDTQTNIRRVAEIIAALDTSVASVSAIKVFPLRFADAKMLATTLRDLFANSARGSTGGSTSGRSGFSPFGGGPPFFGGPPGFGRDGGEGGGRSRSSSGGSSSGGLRAATQVTAVADEHSNSLIVSAPEEYMADIENLIKQVDTAVTDVTELRVFALRNADPVEMAELLSNLFPDPSRQEETRSTGLRFGGGPFPGGFPGFPGSTRTSSRGGNNNTDSERAKKQSRVIAVPDARTSSVIVTAAKDLMDQIAEMILQLDSSAARKQKVFVYPLENANVQEVEGILRNLFETQNTRNTRTTSQQNNPLTTRQNNAAQSQGNPNTTFGSGGLGGGGLGGGGGGGFR
jgi:general secretion pathway protein D